MTADPGEIVKLVGQFTGPDLTQTLSRIEGAVRGVTAGDCARFLESAGDDRDVLSAAAGMKRLAGQINVTIHALGILMCLPHILEPDERVESVSLGAGNTGRDFDLETNVRVAEFKFIRWRSGAETIRQNSIFKDYLLLAEHSTVKRKHLYLLGTEHALRFLRGGRAMSSVLSRNSKLQKMFTDRFGESFRTVGHYYAVHHNAVQIDDVSPWLSELAKDLIAEIDMDAND
ncbi:hypothetical protein [Bradyrhizobium elkanii]|uniref:hypothetical protein n=1 Tax=Bradyrhizobium elkanii TaxID=29448 RepID=UPI001BAA7A26|nr:hypothetical protein [Bradyrhizobium elkanii]MBR1158076.1 hypothetical protein [Bradyrhizobium elkanii]